MSSQAICKAKDIVIKQSVLPAAVLCCKSSTRQSTLQKRRKSKLPRHTPPIKPLIPQGNHLIHCSPLSQVICQPQVLYSKENVLFFNGGSEERPDQEKELALSRMYDNIVREIPNLLDNHDYSIYAPDLEFVSHLPILRTVHGRQSYKVSLMTWFSSLKLLFSDLSIHMISSEKEEGYVTVRWGICGTTRINSNYTRIFDGTSTFYPDDSSGLIKLHILDKVTVNKWKVYNQAPL